MTMFKMQRKIQMYFVRQVPRRYNRYTNMAEVASINSNNNSNSLTRV
jgi:hypothetical protein